LADDVDTAGFIAFAALGLGSAFAGVTLAFAATTFDLGEALLAEALISTFFAAGFVAACFLVLDGTAIVDWTGFFFTVDTTADTETLLFGLITVFVFGLADEVADFAVGFDLEVSFLAIYLLDQNLLQPIIIPDFPLLVYTKIISSLQFPRC
jgi:hypothetical protein